ncbi:hypothetical protein V496_02415 [Pseudogymnoascus sp. VKM F-4515 (FW-2607)]|nr:hypothetical protein V496_02415 [Pseudogymnoascus sp. VKM F-4515 (FW-2607)]KFY80402.1 hypothetical protein V498_08806 [Pseudogymnoascus sp. VKM F-4517 (FW-2822)]
MSSTELVAESAALTAKERARIIVQNSTHNITTTSHSIDRPLRSESPEARTVAGDVRRRTNRVTNAEAPPPSKSDTKSSTKNRAGKGKGRQEKGFGDGDDSGSEGDRKKPRNRGSGDGRAAVKKPLPAVAGGSSGPVDKKYSGLSAEEEQAVKLRRAITAMDGRWAEFEKHNQLCKARSENRGPVLIAKTNLPFASLMVSEDIRLELSRQEGYMEEYKREALFGHIRDQAMEDDETNKMTADSSDYFLKDVLLSVEDALIQRCHDFYRPRNRIIDNKATGMSHMMKYMQEGLWEEIEDSVFDKGQNERDLVAKFLSEHCPSPMIFDLLADQYFHILFEDLVEGVIAKKSGLDVPALTLVKELKDSRCREDQLSNKYAKWAISVLDPTELVKRCKNWPRDTAINDFRSMFKNCKQEFVENSSDTSSRSVEDTSDTSSSSPVSLVLLKGNKLVNIQPVSPKDLRRMGWHQYTNNRFYRYQRKRVEVSHQWQKYLGMKTEITSGKTWFDVVLNVRMDGEVIGILTPEATFRWADEWNTICDGFNVDDISWAVT